MPDDTQKPPQDPGSTESEAVGTSKAQVRRAREAPLEDTSTNRRETGLLAAGVTAVPLLIAAGISVIPALHGVWQTAIGIAALAVITVVVGVQITRSARRLLIAQAADLEVVAYTDDRQTGILLKGDIENVSLRVATIHRIIDALTRAIPEGARESALYNCGLEVGENWVSDFQKELPKLEINRDDILSQLLKWSEYDATAGMGRLTIAVNPMTGEGLVVLANSFLSRARSTFPLNWWFAGYLAGSLNKLLKKQVKVDVIDPTSARTSMSVFQVTPKPVSSVATPSSPQRDPRSLARGPIWIAKLKRPLPDEE